MVQFESESKRSELLVLGSCSLDSSAPPSLPGRQRHVAGTVHKSKQQLLSGSGPSRSPTPFLVRNPGAPVPNTSATSNPHRRRAGSDWRRDFRRQVPPFLAANLVDPPVPTVSHQTAY